MNDIYSGLKVRVDCDAANTYVYGNAENKMNRFAIIGGILSFIIAVIVFIIADGYRRYYSGIFFAILGVALLLQTRRWRHPTDK